MKPHLFNLNFFFLSYPSPFHKVFFRFSLCLPLEVSSSSTFWVSDLLLRSLTYFELISYSQRPDSDLPPLRGLLAQFPEESSSLQCVSSSASLSKIRDEYSPHPFGLELLLSWEPRCRETKTLPQSKQIQKWMPKTTSSWGTQNRARWEQRSPFKSFLCDMSTWQK